MKITSKLPQFTDETALFIVTGGQEAAFYVAENGEIHKVESFKVDRPKYTDIEGHFETRSGGRTMKAGSPFEPTDVSDAAVREFLANLEEEFKSISRHHDVSTLCIFCPSHLKNEVEARIPYNLKEKDHRLFEGNYYNQHPFELLKKVQKRRKTNPIKPMSEAAAKILGKFKK